MTAPALASDNPPIVIHEGDLKSVEGLTTGDTGDAGHSFGDGVLNVTKPADTTTPKVVSNVNLRWTDGGYLSQVHTVNSVWSGSDQRPGVVYDVDITGDGSVDCELVGQQVPGDSGGTMPTVRLNKGAFDFPGSDLYDSEYWPDPCEQAAPGYCDVRDFGSQLESSSDDDEATLDEWAESFNDFHANDDESLCGVNWCESGCSCDFALKANDAPWCDESRAAAKLAEFSFTEPAPDVAKVVYTGITTVQEPTTGSLTSVDVGSNHYVFAGSTASNSQGTGTGTARTADVTGTYRAKQYAHKVVVTLTSDATPSGYSTGKSLVWTYTIDGGPVQTVTQTAGRTDTVTLTEFGNQNRAGTHKSLKLFKNGVKVGVFSVLPRPRYHHHHHKHRHHNAA